MNPHMRVCHTISSVDLESGGPSIYLRDLASGLSEYVHLSVLTLQSLHPVQFPSRVKVVEHGSPIGLAGYSRQIAQSLKNVEVDLFHGNGLWDYPIHAMASIARKRLIPYVISTHGMLEPWSLSVRRCKKRLALELYQNADLLHANCIHATAQAEAQNIRKLGFTNPIAVVAPGIDLSRFPIHPNKKSKPRRTLLFLSRIHPKKGVELLVDAWSKLDRSDRVGWTVKIAGNGEPEYVNSLRGLVRKRGLDGEISFVGPQFGADKLAAYYDADIFVLPTHSENFGMVIAEALACGVPVITTNGTPWEELTTRNSGWWIKNGLQSLVEALAASMALGDNQREEMGGNGRRLVEEKYSIQTVARKMLELYRWVVHDSERPEFVYVAE
jgi:glycosyltransferase involved in cell wall biosynthesis